MRWAQTIKYLPNIEDFDAIKMWNISLINLILIMSQNDDVFYRFDEIKYIIKINFSCFFLLFYCGYWKSWNYLCDLHL